MADDVSILRSWLTKFPDGWGMVRGAVRLATGEPVEGCGVIWYALTPPTAPIPSIGHSTNSEGVYGCPLPAGPYTMAANGLVAWASAEGEIVEVPVIGKATGVVISARQIVNVDIVATERPDLAGWSGDVADLLGIRDWLHQEDR
jgi:hypothetical protein